MSPDSIWQSDFSDHSEWEQDWIDEHGQDMHQDTPMGRHTATETPAEVVPDSAHHRPARLVTLVQNEHLAGPAKPSGSSLRCVSKRLPFTQVTSPPRQTILKTHSRLPALWGARTIKIGSLSWWHICGPTMTALTTSGDSSKDVMTASTATFIPGPVSSSVGSVTCGLAIAAGGPGYDVVQHRACWYV